MKLFRRDLLKSSIKLKDLDTLLVVARKKSFLEAAKELHIAQSTVSMRIAAIEKSFGVRIFRRTLYGVAITEEGAALLKAVESIFSTLSDVQKTMAGAAAAVEHISIATCHTCGLYILPPLVKKFEERHAFKPSMSVADVNRAMARLRNREVDFACVGPGSLTEEYQEYVKRCEHVKLGQDELVVVAPPKNALTGEKSVEIKDLLTQPFLTPLRHADLYREVEKLLQQKGYSFSNFNVVSELESSETIITAVEKGIGISIVSSIPAREAEKEGRVKTLKVLGINDVRNFYLLRNKGEIEKKAAKTFWDFVVSNKKE